MKRFIAYIILCASVLIGVLSGFVPTLLSINASADYDSGQNFVYKISTKEDSTKNDGDIESGEAILTISDMFKDRLDSANISTYKLETEGNDTIRLSFKSQSTINTAIASYLSFDFGLEAIDYTGNIMLETADFFESGSAYIDYTTNSPVIVLPLKNPEDFKTKLYENVNGSKSNSDTETNSINNGVNYDITPFADGDDESTETKNENYIYVVNNWKTTYSLANIIGDSSAADTAETNAYIDRIDATKPEGLFFDYDSTKTDSTFTKLKYTGFTNLSNGDAALENQLAKITLAKFNSSKLDYNLTLINKDYINDSSNNTGAFIENLINHGNQYGSYKSIVMSTLLISVIVAIIIVSLFLILNYGLSGLASISLIPGMLLITLAIFNAFGAEFNIGTIIALIGVGIGALFSALPYYKSVKEEVYKGKSLKKANQEASKRTSMIQIDISVITILLGLVAYLIPNTIMISVGAVLILGGLLNLVINGICLRIIYYFLANSSFVNNHLNLLMIERKKIPDLSKDEKPVYFESLKKKDKKSNFKVFGILGSILLVASIIGIASFQITTGNIYNSSNGSVNESRIYLEFSYNENSAITDVSSLETKVLDNLYTFDATNGTTKKKVSYNDVLTYTYSYKENYSTNKEVLKKVYYIIELKDIYTTDSRVSAYVNADYNLENVSIDEALQYLLVTYNGVSNLKSVSLKEVVNVNNDTNNYYCLIFASIGCAIVSLYFCFRFGISRGLTSLLLVGGSLTITVGIFALTRGVFTSQITLGVILLAIIGYSLLDYIYVQEKNTYHDNKLNITDLAGRKENSRYSLNMTYSNAIIVGCLSAFIVISFLFASTFTTYFIVFTVIGMVLLFSFTRSLELNITYFLYKFFNSFGNRISSNYSTRRAKRLKKKNKTDGNDGPEEAVFIGIND